VIVIIRSELDVAGSIKGGRRERREKRKERKSWEGAEAHSLSDASRPHKLKEGEKEEEEEKGFGTGYIDSKSLPLSFPLSLILVSVGRKKKKIRGGSSYLNIIEGKKARKVKPSSTSRHPTLPTAVCCPKT